MAEWQTRWLQEPVSARTCGFNSLSPHIRRLDGYARAANGRAASASNGKFGQNSIRLFCSKKFEPTFFAMTESSSQLFFLRAILAADAATFRNSLIGSSQLFPRNKIRATCPTSFQLPQEKLLSEQAQV